MTIGNCFHQMTNLINKAAESMIKAMKKAADKNEPIDVKR